MIILHSFWLSLATYRVRIALNLKSVQFAECTHDLTQGHQDAAIFRTINPAGAVPALEGATPEPLTQSLSILEWLEETHPHPPLLPKDAAGRARVRAMFLLSAADTHPLIVPRVRTQLKQHFDASDEAVAQWAAHWLKEGLSAYEAMLSEGATRCHAEQLSIADIALASHLIGAARFDVSLDPYPRVARVSKSLMAIPEIAAAHPNLQIDAPQV